MSELTVKVRSRVQEAQGICSFELVHPQGEPLPGFTAGAHIDVHLGPSLVRQYSLCSPPGERDRWRIAVQLEPASRGGSVAVHEAVQAGGMLRVSTPRNHFELVAAPTSLLIAGGIGITPVIAMAQALHAAGQTFELHYCARSAARMAFKTEIETSPYAQNTRLYLSDGDPQRKFDAARAMGTPDAGKHLYVCGPAGFMDHVLATARALGWPDSQLHREHFAATPVAAALADDSGFEISLARAGLNLTVPPGRTALQVLLDAGVDVAYSCESGVCGTCVIRVLQGVPDHRDSYMTDAEHAAGDQFTPCCSRSRTSRLVLDL